MVTVVMPRPISTTPIYCCVAQRVVRNLLVLTIYLLIGSPRFTFAQLSLHLPSSPPQEMTPHGEKVLTMSPAKQKAPIGDDIQNTKTWVLSYHITFNSPFAMPNTSAFPPSLPPDLICISTCLPIATVLHPSACHSRK